MSARRDPQERTATRNRLTGPRGCRCGCRGVGGERALQHLDGRETVSHRVVDLGDARDPSLVQSVDDREVPQRAVSRQVPRRHLADDGRQLAHAAGCRRATEGHVALEHEGGILDPHGVPEAEWDRHDALAELREPLDALGERRQERLASQTPDGAPHVHDGDLQRVHRRSRGLGVQEAGVEPGELLHRQPAGSRSSVSPAARSDSSTYSPTWRDQR